MGRIPSKLACLALAAAEAWRPERLLPRFEAFFRGVCRAPGGVP